MDMSLRKDQNITERTVLNNKYKEDNIFNKSWKSSTKK